MERKTVQTRDGVELSYLTGGQGRPVFLLGGWSQTATVYAGQFADFCQSHTVYALENRGHGDSQKPSDGYRIERFAKDLFDVVEALDLRDFDAVGHSLSVAMLWDYMEMFGTERPARRLICIDEPAALMARPSWTEKETNEAGSIHPNLESLDEMVTAIRQTRSIEDHLEIIGGMFTSKVNPAALRQLAAENLKLPREYAASLIENLMMQDWRPLLPNIHQPTLVFTGELSWHPLASQQFIADTMPNASLEVFSEAEGGSHFLMFENPALFNEKALGFLNS
ncbi:Pimeloyl-ACP methyl ester carboxylesterase [Pseudovibrio ascidiaceicola]|uniref:Pimeloyl-ACP methyl ester carboxylesterase n=1 Tax=Pseudovibrio ascidiaceicola TaxID=285279 RepID=A0A1I3X8Y9_9HYPH|nr:alpha/beta hydrolase [Pseudovibrio ascidiaceicola]SFK15807.1 Pimeloyl-ACP methyl ester carboxylesterase [Pseudovibrio ascidiaceicola]